jgi:hypothetical protein
MRFRQRVKFYIETVVGFDFCQLGPIDDKMSPLSFALNLSPDLELKQSYFWEVCYSVDRFVSQLRRRRFLPELFPVRRLRLTPMKLLRAWIQLNR